eukprot:2197379-Rhodomonas_salina.4
MRICDAPGRDKNKAGRTFRVRAAVRERRIWQLNGPPTSSGLSRQERLLSAMKNPKDTYTDKRITYHCKKIRPSRKEIKPPNEMQLVVQHVYAQFSAS